VPVTVRVQIDWGEGGWWKVVDDIDRAKSGSGWAIIGSFLNRGQNDIEVGKVVVQCQTSKSNIKRVQVYVVSPTGLEVVGPSDRWLDLRQEFPLLCDTIEMAKGARPPDPAHPLAAFTNEELLAELERRGAYSCKPLAND